jgi:hypothetical protein
LREEKVMVESARKHGPFDGEGGERLEWSAFLARFFPNRRRHDFAALAAYEAYRNALEQGALQQRPTTHRPLEGRRDARSHNRPAAALARAPVSVAPSAAVLAWESEGGAPAERLAG